MTPVCEITIDGAPASSELVSRLVSCTVTDEEGIASDRVEIELYDDPPAAIPRVGAVIGVRMGYAGALSDMGEFVAAEVEVGLLPYRMRITGRSVDLPGHKSQKERHWDDITLGEVVSQIAAENGLAASVDPSLAAFHYDWLGQVDESDVALLERLAKRHNALFAIKAKTIIFAVRGSGLSPSGAALTPLVVTRDVLAPNSASVTWSERAKYAEVAATWSDRAGGRRRKVTVPGDPAGDGTYTIDGPFGSEAEARAAAEAKAAELMRSGVTFSCSIVGDPAARGGAPLTFAGIRLGVDGLALVIGTATHSFAARSGYTTSLTGSLKA